MLVIRYIAIALICVFPSLSVAETSKDYFESGKYDRAFRLGYAKALNGSSSDAFIVGKIILEGLGSATPSQDKGLDLLKFAADNENLEALVYLGNAYYDAEFLPKSNTLAYKYLTKAKEVGADNLDEKLIAIATERGGEISKDTCELFGEKKLKENSFKIGQCIDEGFLAGSSYEYYLTAFDNEDHQALVNAADTLFKNYPDKPLYELFKRIEYVFSKSIDIDNEISKIVLANEKTLYEKAKREKNNALSFQIAQYYEDGTLFGKIDDPKSLEFYKLAKSQGKGGLSRKIQIITIKTQGKTSEGACKGYSKKDADLALTLAKCAEKGHITGPASKYYILAFEKKKNVSAFLAAAKELINKSDKKNYDPISIIVKLPEFNVVANESQKEKFANLVNTYGHSSKDCTETYDALNKKLSGDIYSCLLSAEAVAVTGDFKGMQIAASVWENGTNQIPSNPSYADKLKQTAVDSPMADALSILAILEDDPQAHYFKAQEFIQSGNIVGEDITKVLQLEFKIFADNLWNNYGFGESDFKTLLNLADLNSIEPKILANFVITLFDKYPDIKDSAIVIEKFSPENLKYNSELIVELNSKSPKTAAKFLSDNMMTDCDALEFAMENNSLVSVEKLQQAKTKLLSSCPILNVSPEDLGTILASDINRGVQILDAKLNSTTNFDCEFLNPYIKFENQIKDSEFTLKFDEDFHFLRCSATDPQIAGAVTERLFVQGKYIQAFEQGTTGCDIGATKSCLYAGYLTMRRLANKSTDTFSAKRKAVPFITKAYLKGNDDATFILMQIRQPSLPPKIGLESQKEYEVLMEELERKSYSDGTLMDGAQCAVATNFLATCKSECRAVKAYISSEKASPIQRSVGESILKRQKCISALKN